MFIILAVLAAFVLIEIAIGSEAHIFGIAGLAIFIGTCWFFSVLPWTWAFANISTILIYSIAYLAVGVVWGFVRWYFYMLSARDNLGDVYRKNWLEDKSMDVTYYQYLVIKNQIPQAKKKKHLISIWMIWWPFSIIYTLFDDVVRRFYNWIIEKYLQIYNSISAHVFRLKKLNLRILDLVVYLP